MTSLKVWGWILLWTGVTLDIGIGAIIAIAVLNRDTFGFDGLNWVFAFFGISALIAIAGVVLLALAKNQTQKKDPGPDGPGSS